MRKEVKDYLWEVPEGYTVTRDGKVYNPRGQCLVHRYNISGYPRVYIRHKGYAVHRLVALAHIPNPENKPEIDHIDGNPKNCHADNLRWVTHRENMLNPISRSRISAAGYRKVYSDESMSHLRESCRKAAEKPTLCIDRETKKEIRFKSQDEAAKYFGISKSTISLYVLGKINDEHHIWKRLEKNQ